MSRALWAAGFGIGGYLVYQALRPPVRLPRPACAGHRRLPRAGAGPRPTAGPGRGGRCGGGHHRTADIARRVFDTHPVKILFQMEDGAKTLTPSPSPGFAGEGAGNVHPWLARLAPAARWPSSATAPATGVAGAILVHALTRLGFPAPIEVTGKGGAWSPGVAEQLARPAPQAVLVADLGCRPEPVLPGVPVLFIDHHRPAGVRPEDTLLTGYGLDPTPTSGLLALEAVG